MYSWDQILCRTLGIMTVLHQVAPVPVPTNPSPQPQVVPSGVVLAAAPANLIDISDTGDQEKVKSRKTKNNEKALLLSDDEF